MEASTLITLWLNGYINIIIRTSFNNNNDITKAHKRRILCFLHLKCGYTGNSVSKQSDKQWNTNYENVNTWVMSCERQSTVTVNYASKNATKKNVGRRYISWVPNLRDWAMQVYATTQNNSLKKTHRKVEEGRILSEHHQFSIFIMVF